MQAGSPRSRDRRPLERRSGSLCAGVGGGEGARYHAIAEARGGATLGSALGADDKHRVCDSVCGVAGVNVTSHSEITGDFNSAYTVKSTSHSEGGTSGAHDATMIIEAKWLGACKSDQKPGDIIMPGGMKMNIKDMEKLKGLLPKQK